jgi:hypothetical protein
MRFKRIDRGARDWYQLNRHRKRAKHQLQLEPFCALCAAKGVATPAQLADHVEPHRGDWNSFRLGKLQSLCWRCHSSTKQRLENPERIGIDGFPVDKRHPIYCGQAPSAVAPAIDVGDVIGNIADLIG